MASMTKDYLENTRGKQQTGGGGSENMKLDLGARRARKIKVQGRWEI